MAKLSPEDMREAVSGLMAARAAMDDGSEPSISAEEMAEAMSHPLAAEYVGEMLEREPGSCVAGSDAPDFELPLADGSGSVRLSDHFGKRPVALVFGSYT